VLDKASVTPISLLKKKWCFRYQNHWKWFWYWKYHNSQWLWCKKMAKNHRELFFKPLWM